jgi:hypothetical protein
VVHRWPERWHIFGDNETFESRLQDTRVKFRFTKEPLNKLHNVSTCNVVMELVCRIPVLEVKVHRRKNTEERWKKKAEQKKPQVCNSDFSRTFFSKSKNAEVSKWGFWQ